MANATLVEVLNAADELPVKLGSLLLIKTSISDDKVEKLATVRMFHDHEELLLSFDDLKTASGARTDRRTELERLMKREFFLPRRAE